MKRLIVVILLICMCTGLCACGKSAEVKAVEELISAIGAVSESSEDAIVKAEKAYMALTDDDKNKVENYNTLLDARKSYDAIPKIIELTTENFLDYFNVSSSYGELESYTKMGITFAWVETIVDIYPVYSGTLKNVELTLKITPPIGWSLSSSDSAYTSANKDVDEFTVDIRLPASGEYREVHRLGALMTKSKPYADCIIQIISVDGIFKESK